MTRQTALSVLGLTNTANEDDIKKAFRKMVKKCHPDVVGESGTAMFMQVKEAYKSLTEGSFSAPAMTVTHSSIFKVVRAS